MATLRIALLTSLLCIILGLGIIIGGAVAIPFLNGVISNRQNNATNRLSQANNALARAQNAVNSTQNILQRLNSISNISLPSLVNSSQLTSNIRDNLTAVGQRMISTGQSLSNSSILGATALAAVGSTLTLIGQQIISVANSFGTVSSGLTSLVQPSSNQQNQLNTVTIQLGNLNSTIGSIRNVINQVQNTISSFFNAVKLVVFLSIGALMGLGAVFLLIGLSLFTMRRHSIKLGKWQTAKEEA